MALRTLLLPLAACAPCAASGITWGTATAAYQIEGYREADGRQPSIWDAFDTPGLSDVIRSSKPDGRRNIFSGQNAASADEDYARYPATAQLHQELGFGAARLSVSWPRLLSYRVEGGRLVSSRNGPGIEHYRSVLEAFRSRGVQVALTLFHWDMPLAIEEFAASQPCGSAWLCHEWIADVFAEFAATALHEYRDSVDWWITINEPLTVATNGYNGGNHAPGRCSDRDMCWAGNSSTEPYMVVKGLLLAHARAFRAWHLLGRPGRGCGITLNGDWRVPATTSDADAAAATRSLEWQAAIFADPIHFGRWPESIVESAKERLPGWSEADVALVSGSHDGHFFMNHYTSNYARATERGDCGWDCDQGAETAGYSFSTGKPIGTPSSTGWLFNYGPGIGQLLGWYHRRYPGLKFIVTENGWGNASSNQQAEMEVDDRERCNYYRDYLGNLSAAAAQDGIEVVAYFAWSLFDNFEWADGFSTRFGLTYVDYETQERVLKMSATWFKRHVTGLKELPTDGQPFPPCDDGAPLPAREVAIVL